MNREQWALVIFLGLCSISVFANGLPILVAVMFWYLMYRVIRSSKRNQSTITSKEKK